MDSRSRVETQDGGVQLEVGTEPLFLTFRCDGGLGTLLERARNG